MKQKFSPFTRSATILENKGIILQSSVVVSRGSTIDKTRNKQSLELTAIWDTGTTKSCITQKVIEKLNSQPIGNINFNTASEVSNTDVYLVDLKLPDNNAISYNISVLVATIIGEADMLIGMDVIGAGDFAFSNYKNNPLFTFRLPSQKTIDFVQDENQHKLRGSKQRTTNNKKERRNRKKGRK